MIIFWEFWELRNQKKGEERGQKLVRNLDPFLVPLSIWHIPEGSENGLIFGPAFSAGKLLESRNLHAESPFFGKMQRMTPKCSQLLLVLNMYSFSSNQVEKLAAFLPSATATGEALVADTFWKGFSVWKLSPSNRPKTELFGKKSAGRAQPPPEAH